MNPLAHESPVGLTLVICTYNNASTLALTLAHIEAQGADALRDTTVLVIDNNCTDATPEVVAAAQARGVITDLRRIVETRQGQAYARLRGVAEAGTEWIGFIDDDNLLQAGWITHAKAFIASHPRCGAFGGRIEIAWEIAPTELLRKNDYAYARLNLPGGMQHLHGEDRWHLRGAGLVCRASVLRQAGWPDWQACIGRQRGHTAGGDDLEIVMRIAREGFEIWYVPECWMRHFISASRISENYIARLHFGFGLAHPLLIGFKRRQGRLRWSVALIRSTLREFARLGWCGVAGIAQPLRRREASLHWAYLRGTSVGLRTALALGPVERAIWLGGARPPKPAVAGGAGSLSAPTASVNPF